MEDRDQYDERRAIGDHQHDAGDHEVVQRSCARQELGLELLRPLRVGANRPKHDAGHDQHHTDCHVRTIAGEPGRRVAITAEDRNEEPGDEQHDRRTDYARAERGGLANRTRPVEDRESAHQHDGTDCPGDGQGHNLCEELQHA